MGDPVPDQSHDPDKNGNPNTYDEIEVVVVNALKDNYCYLVRRRDSDRCLIIDTSEFEPIRHAVETRGWTPELILNTHHHHDHVGANVALRELWNCEIYCSEVDLPRIPDANRGLRDGEIFEFNRIEIHAVLIPGHTQGQLGYYFPQANRVFVGDTLFSMGCGRLLEGTSSEMVASLHRLSQLPPETRLHFGHEYAEKNGAFAATVEPDNGAIQDRLRTTREGLSRCGYAAAPLLKDELRVNPFLRLDSRSIRRQLGMTSATDLEVFVALRRLRNLFRG